MRKFLMAGTIALAMVMAPAAAMAVPFTGSVDYIGTHTPDVANMNLATQSSIMGPGGVGDPVVAFVTGTFAAEFGILDPLDHTSPLVYRPFGGPYTPLWTHVASGISFDLLTMVIESSSATTLTLKGTGLFTGGGYTDTEGNWNMTLNIATGQTTGSFSSSAAVPEPGILALLGLGLLGVARRYRK